MAHSKSEKPQQHINIVSSIYLQYFPNPSGVDKGASHEAELLVDMEFEWKLGPPQYVFKQDATVMQLLVWREHDGRWGAQYRAIVIDTPVTITLIHAGEGL